MNTRIVCLGANLESKIALERLVEEGANVAGLITLPSGSGAEVSDYVDLHDYAKNSGIETIDTLDVNSPATIDAIRSLNADYLFVLGWSQLLRADALNSVAQFVVGSHPTPLPLRRGRAPIPWTVIEGLSSSAVTLFKMTDKIDDGPILLQTPFDIGENPYAMDVYMKVAEVLASSFVALYKMLSNNEFIQQPDNDSVATYRGKRTPQDGFIDFSLPSLEIVRLIRAVSKPYPGAYFYYRNQRIVVWCSEEYQGPERIGVSGQILARDGDGLIVRAADGCLKLWDFHASERPISRSEFLVGDVFNYRICDELFQLKQRVSQLEGLLSRVVGKLDA